MRLLDLIFYLLKCNSRVKLNKLADVFGVSIKTIQRDIDKLSVLGIPVIVHRGKNGGVEIDKNYIITRQVLKYSDYEALMLSLCIGESLSQKVKDSCLIDKIRILATEESCHIVDTYRERFIVDLYENKIDLQSEVIKEADKAMNNKLCLELKLENKKTIVFPISYVLRKEGLCLYCYNGDYLLILIDKILNATIYNESYDGNITHYNDNKMNVKFLY